MEPKLYNTANVLRNPAEQFAGSTPMGPPTSTAAALQEQKKLRESGIETTKAAYVCGAEEACVTLGLAKTAARINPLRSWFRRILEGSQGTAALKVPIQATLGGLAGAAAGEMHSGDPWAGAALGAGSLGVRGFLVEQVPALRRALLRRL